ncbi:MAG: hypothetical protein KF819_21615 [Labilithrix sp.]|nr:hypothetical protein [Labilithrix sp.]
MRRNALLIATLFSVGCRGSLSSPRGAQAISEETRSAIQLLCSDIGESACVAACPGERATREHVECLLSLRFGTDPEALEMARALYAGTNAVVGVEVRGSIEGYAGEEVELYPALPVGEHRHHLRWLHSSLVAFDGFVGALGSRTEKTVTFTPRPRGFAFFQTASPAYPSAYCWEGVIAYNIQGPLHGDHREVHETLFHELFHMNDAARSMWSTSALGPLFDSIVERCADEHECLAPFAPHGTVVPDGTYYAFDPRTRDVREYAAELAVRYFLEHETILAGEAARLPPFKCATAENQIAWSRLVDEFFGGVDLSPSCDET